MLSHFPHPHPDELLYSVVARYSARMRYPSIRGVVRDMFNTGNASAVVDLPSNLDRLLVNMPPGHRYTIEWLINHCTMLPFYAPFLPWGRVEQLQRDMAGSNGSEIQMRVGLMASSVPNPEWLRFCPQCVSADRSRFGETYWHRLHQISGITVCPEHQVFLEDSPVGARNAPTRYLFTAADEVVDDRPARPLDNTKPEHRFRLQLAADAAILLTQPVRLAEPVDLRQRYLRLLAERELATHTGRLRLSRLVEDFIASYTPALLEQLHCPVNPASGASWLARLIRRPEIAQHPLHHLLLIQFLGHSVAEFFRVSPEPAHFGTGPWPCLNPTCRNYRQPVINTCHVNYCQNSGRPIGGFTCQCGFRYSRVGPDRTIEDRCRLNRVDEYGAVWENRLRQLWPDSTVSLRELSRQLGVAPQTVQRNATRLGLPISRPGNHNGQLPDVDAKKTESMELAETLTRQRQGWLVALAEQPNAGVNELRQRYGSVFNWLYYHDRDWLDQHKPPRKRRHFLTVRRVDWIRRDTIIAVDCLQAARQLVETPGKPKYLTQNAIIRQTSHGAVIRLNPDKLPCTLAILAEVVESRLDFALRRIEWAMAEFSRAGIVPKRWQMIRHSGTEDMKNWTEVKLALDIAGAWLDKSVSTGLSSPPPMAVRDRLIAKISTLVRQFEVEQPKP